MKVVSGQHIFLNFHNFSKTISVGERKLRKNPLNKAAGQPENIACRCIKTDGQEPIHGGLK